MIHFFLLIENGGSMVILHTSENIFVETYHDTSLHHPDKPSLQISLVRRRPLAACLFFLPLPCHLYPFFLEICTLYGFSCSDCCIDLLYTSEKNAGFSLSFAFYIDFFFIFALSFSSEAHGHEGVGGKT